ncbi:aminotransferase class I and II [Cytophagaceae bacterium DM2B3-1]|uniref:Aminotransferase class I and II n=1 Tax=Xanthocytophaga flava TaxID=3048013 RepID=A0ABT7CD38_9BACT|nr:HipA family kinase [Xanthocytophaga flavus]MDJ1470545.1 aminotransferase class I and II [Xanthocytophaga flavus]MDJ1491612.1 aminotransferase class I and II [Xanthocytophaga flavus]
MNNSSSHLRTVHVTRYVTPLREGGSLPALVEADDDFLYVLKFRGAGQGVKALIAELIGGELARALGMRVPEIVYATIDPALSRTEPDEEIQDLLRASDTGLNLAVHYLSGAITFDPVVNTVEPYLASKIVWLDCLITNVDRTARNTNMLIWHKELWLIDHGASLYFHHSGQNWEEHSRKPFAQVKDHVLLPQASELEKIDTEVKSILTSERIRSIVGLVPDIWLTGGSAFISADEERDMYIQFLETRLASSEIFVKEAQHAREALI